MKKAIKVLSIVFLMAVVMGSGLIGVTGAQKSVTIKWAHYFDPMTSPAHVACIDWMWDVIKDYEGRTGNEVKMEFFKWDEIDSKMMTDYRAGIVHDVVFESPQLIPKHKAVGDLLSLSPYIEGWSKAKVKDFSWSPVWKKSYPLGIPMGVHTRALVYRRDYFKEVGLNPDRPPKNLDELVKYAKKLTRDIDGDGKVDIWGLGMYLGPSRATIELFFAPFAWHFGGQLWDPETKKATFASDAGVKAAEFLYDLIYKYKVTPRWSISGAYDDRILLKFLDGKYGMAWGWGSYWIQPLEKKGMIQGCFPATKECKPVTADVTVTPTKPKAQFTNAWLISIHKLSEHPDEDFKLIEEATSPEKLLTFPDAGLPALASLWEEPKFKTDFYKEWYQAASHGRPVPPTAHYSELADSVATALSEILAKPAPKEKIPEILKKYQDAYNTYYAGK